MRDRASPTNVQMRVVVYVWSDGLPNVGVFGYQIFPLLVSDDDDY